ncbi:MAG: type II secretion system F family protein [Myxococcota bacterium]
MPVYEYKALDAAGKSVSSVIDADTAKVARTRLRKQGLFPTEIREQAGKSTRQGESILDMQIDVEKYFQFITARDISTMTQQLSTLVGAHVPMAEALSALVDQTEKQKLKVVLSKIKERVNEGSTLADAMAQHPRVFDDLFVQMIRAGEKSGALSEVLHRLATYADGQVKLQGKIISAVAYPILLGLMGTGMLAGIFLFVIPRVRTMFDSMPGGEENLPFISKAVFFFGDALTSWTGLLVPVFLVATFLVWRQWVRTENGRATWDRWRLKWPLLGKMARLVSVSRFCRTMSTLLVSGVPIVSALKITEAVVGNVVIGEAVVRATESIQEGQSIAVPLRQSGEFPPLVTHMIGIGERTGELERMLTVVADSYDDQVDATITALTSLLAPLMIFAVGGVVFLVALGLLLPLQNMMSAMR